MKRIHRILKARQVPKVHRRRRGPRRQHDRREAERIARISALIFARWAHRQGLSVTAAAHQLGMDPSTLRSWEARWSADRLEPHPRGRPIDAVDRDGLWSFLAAFGIIGPQIGLPTLQDLFPGDRACGLDRPAVALPRDLPSSAPSSRSTWSHPSGGRPWVR